jgi:hypothetical protein
MNNQIFGIGSKVVVAGRVGVWYIEEMVLPCDGILADRPYWLSPDGIKAGWIRAAESEMTVCD